MKKSIASFLILATVFFMGSGKGSSTSQSKEIPAKKQNAIARTFEDLVLGMSEDEFKSKLLYSHIPKRPYIVYSRLYNMYHLEQQMEEIDNVYQVFCFFFDGKLYGISIEYNYDYHPSWEEFTFNTKQKYGKGKEDVIGKSIVWNDAKTMLEISEESGEQFDSYVSYYLVSYIDVEIKAQLSKNEKESSPEF
jgi:hypothetical protein